MHTLESLTNRLQELQNTTYHIRNDIARLKAFKPKDSRNGKREVEELNKDIYEAFKAQKEDWEILDQDIEYLVMGPWGSPEEAHRERLADRSERAYLDVKAARADYSKAQRSAVIALRLIERAERKERVQRLVNPQKFEDTSAPPSRRRTPAPEQTQDEKLVGAAGDVTAALRRTHALLANELNRSQFAHDTLKESSAALGQLSENYTSLDSVLNSTKSLLGTLMKSQKSDTWYLETAFYILLATVFWLIFRRFIYGPAWWFVYLPLKLSWKTLLGAANVLGLKDGQAVSSYGDGMSGTSSSIGMGTTTVEAAVSGMDAPKIQVAGEDTRGKEAEEKPLSEQVGKIVDGSNKEDEGADVPQEQEHGDDAQHEDQVQPNPLKRQWDAHVEAPKHEAEMERRKDEL